VSGSDDHKPDLQYCDGTVLRDACIFSIFSDIKFSMCLIYHHAFSMKRGMEI